MTLIVIILQSIWISILFGSQLDISINGNFLFNCLNLKSDHLKCCQYHMFIIHLIDFFKLVNELLIINNNLLKRSISCCSTLLMN